jgi:hypothetical protein
MEKYGYDLGLANESSFGPHPTLYFVPADEEIMIFIDKKLKLEITVKKLTTNTNYCGKSIVSTKELKYIIVKIKRTSKTIMIKYEL